MCHVAGELQVSATVRILFLIHINDLLFATRKPIQCFADGSTPRSSISVNQRLWTQEQRKIVS